MTSYTNAIRRQVDSRCCLLLRHYLWRKSNGDKPERRLKNFPNEDWSEKLSRAVISWIDMREVESSARDSA